MNASAMSTAFTPTRGVFRSGARPGPTAPAALESRRPSDPSLQRRYTAARASSTGIKNMQDTGVGLPKLGPQFEPIRDGPPGFQTLAPYTMESVKADTKPIMVYLPGIDGTGLAAYRQFPRIQEQFSLITLCVPTSDRTSFEGLVTGTVSFLQGLAADIATERPVYILGESFGGVLAVAVAAQCKDAIDRIVLVNPATSYEDTPWKQLRPILKNIPAGMYPNLPYALAPVLGNPLAMAGHTALGVTNPFEAAAAYRDGLLSLIPTLGKLAEILPQDTLDWKLQLLEDGNEYVKDKFAKVPQRTLVLASDSDSMLPSEEEGKRLPQIMPNCRTREFKGRSHALLQEAGVDLCDILAEEGFFVTKRNISGTAPTKGRNANNFGLPGPVELPTPREVEIGGERSGWLRTAVSPVFYSTDAAGRVAAGLGNLNVEPGKPVLLVGNHQTVPTDLAFIIEQVLREKETLVRGLVHPGAVMDASAFATAAQSAVSNATATPRATKAPKRNTFADFLTAWGAVPVGAKALHDLLQNGECVLLFPGGAQEALKGTSTPEKYKLYWSSRPEFVRAAAKFSATIIPFGAIGAEEQVKSVMGSATLAQLSSNSSRAKRPVVQARKGVARSDPTLSDSLASPLYLPVSVQRYYYLFGRPISTTPDMKKDKAAAAELYQDVQDGVEDCVTYLLENRERDPYRSLLRRLAYEQSWKKPAPGFEVDSR